MKPFESGGLAFCNNDLSTNNVIFDPETLKKLYTSKSLLTRCGRDFLLRTAACIVYRHGCCLRTGHNPCEPDQRRAWRLPLRCAFEIARNKLGDMDKNGFEDIVAEFALQFESQKQLACELRSTLFSIKDGAIFTGTFRDNDIMYDGIIGAFSRAIDRLRKEEQAIA
ncbi:hypothetical protein G7Y89_g244 [Cudoniella acicularis]|uniref:Uncharacterized protein n=1 Tax=Cudoniella acicularis TaxID=354080 RepID=A0A8H4RYE8_9HELO|nr:hypothetical protein G7Y89_g244 [Cudoniella acicularis]